MSRKPTLEPRWLVGLLNAWARRTSREKGLGYPTLCAMLKDGIPGRVRSYEPTGYGDADLKDIDQAVSQLDVMRRLAVMRYFKPWMARAIDAEYSYAASVPNMWATLLREALAMLETKLARLKEGAPCTAM